MDFPCAVQGYVDPKFVQVRGPENPRDAFRDSFRENSVRGDRDGSHPDAAEESDDLGDFLAQEGFPPGQKDLTESTERLEKFPDLGDGKPVLLPSQLFPVETVIAGGVAPVCHEKDERHGNGTLPDPSYPEPVDSPEDRPGLSLRKGTEQVDAKAEYLPFHPERTLS